MKVKIKSDNMPEVNLDDWDTQNGDYHLAAIIHPLLTRLRSQYENDKAFPTKIDSSDIPKEIIKKEKIITQKQRFLYVLNEMIFAFGAIYIHGFIPSENTPEKMMCGKRHEIENSQRIQNGLRLFGKYYRVIWE